MNIEYARTIPLRDILGKIGLQPAQQNNTTLFYPPPSGGDATASLLQVEVTGNTWLDSQSNTCGGPAELVCAYLAGRGKPSTLSDALHWLKFNIGYPALSSFLAPEDEPESNGQYSVHFKTLLMEKGLIRYAENRGIPVVLARQFLKQVYIRNTTNGREFLALGIKNEEGGYAIHSPFIHAHLGPRAISFMRGKAGTAEVHIFKDIFDCLLAIVNRNNQLPEADTIILHSYSCLDNASAYVRGYGYHRLYSSFDRSPVGLQATEACAFLAASEPGLQHISIDLANGAEVKA